MQRGFFFSANEDCLLAEAHRGLDALASATQTQYTARMKSAVIPQVRVEPELRAELEAVLQEGETLSEFVESSVRSAVAFRRIETRFHARGQAAWEHYETTGESLSAADVLIKLQAKLDVKRKQLGG